MILTNDVMTQLELGAQLRDEGIQRAVDHADREKPKWSDLAYQALLGMRGEFTSEDVRIQAEYDGLPKPPDARAWGGVVKRALKAGHIRFLRYGKSCNPFAHQRPVSVWVSYGGGE